MDLDVLPVVAVRVAVWALVTAATFAVKPAEVAVAGTVTEVGTVTDPLLLATATLKPPVGAEPDSVTMHESASDPVIDALLHVRPLTTGASADPVPVKLTVAVGAVLAIASCPVTELAVVG
jgi:hypothetical protein